MNECFDQLHRRGYKRLFRMHHLVTVIVVGRFVMQFLVANGVSPSTMQILDTIRDRVYSQTHPLALADLYNRPLYLQCDLSRYIYNWTGRLPPPSEINRSTNVYAQA